MSKDKDNSENDFDDWSNNDISKEEIAAARNFIAPKSATETIDARLASTDMNTFLQDNIITKEKNTIILDSSNNLIGEQGVDQQSSKDVINNNTDRPITILRPVIQESRKHWVANEIKIDDKDNVTFKIIDSKGGAFSRPDEEYSQNPIIRAAQKVKDFAIGIKDTIISKIAYHIDESKIKKEISELTGIPVDKIKGESVRLGTQHDDIQCGRHTVANIASLAKGEALETNINKAHNAIKEVQNKVVEGEKQRLQEFKADAHKNHEGDQSKERGAAAQLTQNQTFSPELQAEAKKIGANGFPPNTSVSDTQKGHTTSNPSPSKEQSNGIGR